MRIFGREPVFWLSGLQALLAVAVAFPVLGITPDMAAWVVTVATAVLAAAEAWLVRPFTVGVMTAAIKASLAALVMFGLPIPTGLDAALVAFGTFIVGVLMAPNVTPAASPDRDWLAARTGNYGLSRR
ncbi:hypothetical protein [Nonomuraea sp. NPDC050786]|uniref:hypothetical protein n=1 Tax=Nonomuraea sp. NPDC050786 TaxID=3154840 RepID=UPI0033E9ADC8